MRCIACGSAMKTRVEEYLYTECGLPDVVLVGVKVSRCPSCGKQAVSIPNVEGLHKAIARALADKRDGLTPQEIRFLRKSLGFSGAEFARVMGKTPETVSRWESVTSPMMMDAAAERLLRLMVMTREPLPPYPLERLSNVATSGPAPVKLSLRRGARERWTAKEEEAA
jgi:putative zinc finger/helix-turn-helix YgiT family protein